MLWLMMKVHPFYTRFIPTMMTRLTNTSSASFLVENVNRSVCRDVIGLRIYMSGWQEMENFHCLSLKTQL